MKQQDLQGERKSTYHVELYPFQGVHRYKAALSVVKLAAYSKVLLLVL